jgi:N-methylhydantoinase A/oxoprolinase/acetone carboxylase beta subunit
VYRIGVDVGGTFTDLVAVDDFGKATLAKAPSIPDDPSVGVIDGLGLLAETLGTERRVAVAGLLSALPQEPGLPEASPVAPRSERRTDLDDDWVTSPVYDFKALAPKQTIAGRR